MEIRFGRKLIGIPGTISIQNLEFFPWKIGFFQKLTFFHILQFVLQKSAHLQTLFLYHNIMMQYLVNHLEKKFTRAY